MKCRIYLCILHKFGKDQDFMKETFNIDEVVLPELNVEHKVEGRI